MQGLHTTHWSPTLDTPSILLYTIDAYILVIYCAYLLSVPSLETNLCIVGKFSPLGCSFVIPCNLQALDGWITDSGLRHGCFADSWHRRCRSTVESIASILKDGTFIFVRSGCNSWRAMCQRYSRSDSSFGARTFYRMPWKPCDVLPAVSGGPSILAVLTSCWIQLHFYSIEWISQYIYAISVTNRQ